MWSSLSEARFRVSESHVAPPNHSAGVAYLTIVPALLQFCVCPIAPFRVEALVMTSKAELLSRTIEHIDIKQHNVVPLVDAMAHMAYSSRDLHRAAEIYDRMLRDKDCGVILTLAGSLISAGLKKVFVDMIRNNMVDAIVSTGANMVDQDFFEALGFKHYVAADEFKSGTRDSELREHAIDRIYDTFIDEDE